MTYVRVRKSPFPKSQSGLQVERIQTEWKEVGPAVWGASAMIQTHSEEECVRTSKKPVGLLTVVDTRRNGERRDKGKGCGQKGDK